MIRAPRVVLSSLVIATVAASAATADRSYAQDTPSPFGETRGSLEVKFKPTAEGEGPLPGGFECVGKVTLPDEALINVGLKRVGQDEYIGDAWARCKLVSGEYRITLGPFDERKVLRGEYVIDAWLYIARQPKFVYDDLRRRMRVSRDHRELIGTSTIRIGDAADETADTKDSNGKLKAIFATLKGVHDRVIEKVEAPPPAMAEEERKTFRKGNLRELGAARKELQKWYRGYIGVPATEHVAIVETLVSAVNALLKAWEGDPNDEQIGQMSHQATKMVETFTAVPLPGEDLDPSEDGAGGENEGEAPGDGD